MGINVISEQTIKIIEQHVDAYISELRFDFICLRHDRKIEELGNGKFSISDTDLIVDANQNYEILLQHPLERFFIPEKIEIFQTQFFLTLEEPDLVKFVDFDTGGVIGEQEFSLDDPQISDSEIEDLVERACFDKAYQKRNPEVTEYLQEVFKEKHSEQEQKGLDRLRPFLGV